MMKNLNIADPIPEWRNQVPKIERISLNQKTCTAWTLREAAEACAQLGFKWFGPRLDALRSTGLAESRRIFKNLGMKISSVCFSGDFVHHDTGEREKCIEACLRCIDDTAEVNGNVLVIIPGTDIRCTVEEGFSMIEDGIARVLPYAEEMGIVLGIEPLHPIYAADLSIMVTIKQAIDMMDKFNSPYLKLTVDTFHTWWDPDLENQIRRAEGRICGYHVNDWIPIRHTINASRGMMGDGLIPLRRIRSAIEDSKYFGPIEVEIFNEDLWHMPCETVLHMCKDRYQKYV